MQKFKNIVNVLIVAISLSSRGLNRDNVFLYEKKCMPRGGRLAYKIIFQEIIHFECGPLYFYHFLSRICLCFMPTLIHLSCLRRLYSSPALPMNFVLLRYRLQVNTYLLPPLAFTITEELTD